MSSRQSRLVSLQANEMPRLERFGLLVVALATGSPIWWLGLTDPTQNIRKPLVSSLFLPHLLV